MGSAQDFCPLRPVSWEVLKIFRENSNEHDEFEFEEYNCRLFPQFIGCSELIMIILCLQTDRNAAHWWIQLVLPLLEILTYILMWWSRVDSRFAPSQWEAALLCNDVSHWLVAKCKPRISPDGVIWWVNIFFWYFNMARKSCHVEDL